MMKKVFFILICAAGFSLVSCGSTKDQVAGEIDSIDELVIEAPDAAGIDQLEQMAEDAVNAAEAEAEADAGADVDKAAAVEADVDANATTPENEPDLSYDNPDFPPLEEITEPELIDVPYEEVVRTKNEQKEKEEAEQAKLVEPVADEDVTPPSEVVLQEPEEPQDGSNTNGELEQLSGVPEALEGPLEEDIEPTIEIQETPEEIIITPSRSVSLKKGETLVITYPGSGWIYMGSTSEYNNLASRGRKLGTTDTKYTLLAKEAGTQIHHFYKVDNLTGNYIDDYIEVTVLEKKGTSSTVVNAPDYKEVVPKKAEAPAKASTTKKKEAEEKAQQAEQTEAAKPQETQTTTKAATQTTTKTTAPAASKKDDEPIVIDDEETEVVEVLEEGVEAIPDLEAYMTQAKALIQSKDYIKAYNDLTTYLEYANDGRDEALYMLGQLLEADSPIKNIKEAINTYQSLCDSYPASKYWDSANKRIIYLKRFYIDIH
ncbi:MAG: hypothetical protein J5726_02020 [Treponema sp.]|nr:hypothetical protein [Treponema sp.]